MFVGKARVARSARAVAIGTLRPAIVLYDEPHPSGDEIGALQTRDMAARPDLLLVMGTSLKVHGLKRLVRDFAGAVHARPGGKVVFVNRTPPPAEWSGVFDIHVRGETDGWVGRVMEEWKRLRPADWEVQTTLGTFKVVKPAAPAGKKKQRKTEVDDAENIVPVAAPSPSSSATLVDVASPSPDLLPPVPLSPSKRQSTCTHDDPHASPRKKRAGLRAAKVVADPEEEAPKGMLFGTPKSAEEDLKPSFEPVRPVVKRRPKRGTTKQVLGVAS